MDAPNPELMGRPTIAPLKRKVHPQVHPQAIGQTRRTQRVVKAGPGRIGDRTGISRTNPTVKELEGIDIKGPREVATGLAFDIQPKVGELGVIPYKDLSTGQGAYLVWKAGVGDFLIQVGRRKSIETIDLQTRCGGQALPGPQILSQRRSSGPRSQSSR